MAIPDSSSGWGLQDVVDEVNPDAASAIPLVYYDLQDCFADANADYFDSNYYGTENDLLEFRNYGSHNAPLTISVDPTSFSVGAGSHIEYSTVTTEPDSGDWAVKSSPTWVTATKDSTTQLKMAIQSNSGSARTGFVVVRHNDDIDTTALVRITQETGQ